MTEQDSSSATREKFALAFRWAAPILFLLSLIVPGSDGTFGVGLMAWSVALISGPGILLDSFARGHITLLISAVTLFYVAILNFLLVPFALRRHQSDLVGIVFLFGIIMQITLFSEALHGQGKVGIAYYIWVASYVCTALNIGRLLPTKEIAPTMTP